MKKALFGYGGQAKEINALFNYEFTFVVDDEYANEHCLPLSQVSPNEYELLIAVGESGHRKNIAQKLSKFSFFTLVHNTAIIASDAVIGCGTFIGPYCLINNKVEIGSHSIINRLNSIGHDSKLGDFSSMMSSSVVSGNCNIGSCCYLGNSCSVKEKINICDNVKIGMNAAVVKSIYESGVYVGVPTKRIK